MAYKRVHGAVSIEIKGIDDLMKKLDGKKLLPRPARRFLNRLGILGTNLAKEHTPVDRGRLRQSIAYEVSNAKIPDFTKIGTNLVYGRALHDGWKSESGKMPPVKAIAAWVKRKGLTGSDGKPLPAFVIARNIAERGFKTLPDGAKYLEKAVADLEPKMPALLDKLGDEIRAEWER